MTLCSAVDDRHGARSRHRARPIAFTAPRLAALALAVAAFPGQPAAAAPTVAEDDTASGARAAAAPGPQPSFETAFEPLGSPSPVSSPDPGAVDLTAFEPPRGPRVVRRLGTGVASYYGKRFHGRRTANGERFDMYAMTAAHKTLPFGTHVRVTNPANGRAVTVRINDRGPFIAGRSIDLSRAAAQRIGLIQRGHARVQIDIVAP
ncbi:MAG: septal ring lytic transglycosylase RlpA family protein [Pseudomonadota bacterium]